MPLNAAARLPRTRARGDGFCFRATPLDLTDVTKRAVSLSPTDNAYKGSKSRANGKFFNRRPAGTKKKPPARTGARGSAVRRAVLEEVSLNHFRGSPFTEGRRFNRGCGSDPTAQRPEAPARHAARWLSSLWARIHAYRVTRSTSATPAAFLMSPRVSESRERTYSRWVCSSASAQV